MNLFKVGMYVVLLLTVAYSQVVVINFGCRTYEPDGVTCKLCSNRFFMDSDKICQPVSDACKEYNAENGACTACYEGDFLVERVCIPDPRPLMNPYCAEFDEGACVKCSKGFYLLNNTCTIIDPLCKTFDQEELACVECYMGYGLDAEGTCKIEAAERDEGCSKFKEDQCEQCSKGYYFDQDRQCVMANSLCRTFDNSNGDCLSCYAGFKLEAGVC